MRFGTLLTVVAIGILLPLAVLLYTYAGAHPISHPTAPIPSPVVIPDPVPADAPHLNGPRAEQIAEKIIDGLATKFPALSPTSGATAAKRIRTTDTLKRDVTQIRKEVQDLSKDIHDLSVNIQGIDQSLSMIDSGLSTPAVLRRKLEQQPNGLRP